MNETKKFEETPSLVEVWEWKDAVAKEMEGKTWEEQMEIYDQAMVKAAKILNKKIVKLPNGSSVFV